MCFNQDKNIETITVTEEVSENILDNTDPEDIVIIPPRSKNVSVDLVAIDQGKEDKGDGEVSEKKKAPKKIENILDDPNSEKIVIIPLRRRDVNGELTDCESNQGKEDYVLQNGKKKKKKTKKISREKVRGPSTTMVDQKR